MQYRNLGNTGLHVSELCLGSMTWGEQNSESEAFAQLDYATAQGVNFIDTAEIYPVPPRSDTQGSTETCIGNWLAKTGKRNDMVVATKVTGRGDRNAGTEYLRGGPRLSRDHITRAVEGSLQRLQTDYIDLYQLHWPERITNFFGRLGYSHSEDDSIALHETLQAMAELVKSGKVRHIGVSNETPWGVMECLRLAREYDLPVIASIQNPYNLLNRVFEIGLAEMVIRENMAMLAYSPLGFGVLSGKYLNGNKPEGARLTLFDRFQRYARPAVSEAVAAYVALAQAHGLDPAQMALAYVRSREFVTSTIIGATTMAQLQSNIASVDLILSQEVVEGIEAIHGRNTNPAP